MMDKWTHWVQLLTLTLFLSSLLILLWLLVQRSLLGIGKIKANVWILIEWECWVLSLWRIDQRRMTLRRQVLPEIGMYWCTCSWVGDSHILRWLDHGGVPMDAEEIPVLLWLIACLSLCSTISLIFNQVCRTTDLQRQVDACGTFLFEELIIADDERLSELLHDCFWILDFFVLMLAFHLMLKQLIDLLDCLQTITFVLFNDFCGNSCEHFEVHDVVIIMHQFIKFNFKFFIIRKHFEAKLCLLEWKLRYHLSKHTSQNLFLFWFVEILEFQRHNNNGQNLFFNFWMFIFDFLHDTKWIVFWEANFRI